MFNKFLIIGAVVLAILLGTVGFYYVHPARKLGNEDSSRIPSPIVAREYKDETYGIVFIYPQLYFLEKGFRGAIYSIELTEDTEENRDVREGRSPGREGPPSITLRIFSQGTRHYNTQQWIEGVRDSEYLLSPDKILTPRTVGGREGLAYRWSGLYEGESVATATEKYVYVFSVNYFTSDDPIRDHFADILESVIWLPR